MPNLVVTVTGTLPAGSPAVKGQAVGGNGVLIKDSGDTDFDARTCQQKGLNLYDEVNQFIAGMAAALGVPGFVVISQVGDILATLRRTPSMGENYYAP